MSRPNGPGNSMFFIREAKISARSSIPRSGTITMRTANSSRRTMWVGSCTRGNGKEPSIWSCPTTPMPFRTGNHRNASQALQGVSVSIHDLRRKRRGHGAVEKFSNRAESRQCPDQGSTLIRTASCTGTLQIEPFQYGTCLRNPDAVDKYPLVYADTTLDRLP
jgi:hypothetical protein